MAHKIEATRADRSEDFDKRERRDSGVVSKKAGASNVGNTDVRTGDNAHADADGMSLLNDDDTIISTDQESAFLAIHKVAAAQKIAAARPPAGVIPHVSIGALPPLSPTTQNQDMDPGASPTAALGKPANMVNSDVSNLGYDDLLRPIETSFLNGAEADLTPPPQLSAPVLFPTSLHTPTSTQTRRSSPARTERRLARDLTLLCIGLCLGAMITSVLASVGN